MKTNAPQKTSPTVSSDEPMDLLSMFVIDDDIQFTDDTASPQQLGKAGGRLTQRWKPLTSLSGGLRVRVYPR